MNEILINRPTSGFSLLSIGTGLAIESIFDPIDPVYDESREVPNKVNVSDYSLYIFNTATLLRNLINSIKFKDLILVAKMEIYNTLLQEIEFLSNIFATNSLTIKFYINNYNFVKDTYGKSNKLRVPNTDKQLYISNIVDYCLNKLIKENYISSFSNDIKYNKLDKALLFTHIPWDLLSYKNFVTLDLLESNTGVVKSRKDFNTKYYKIPNLDMSFLPFMEYLLVTFGDNVMFHPSPLNERLKLYDQLKKKRVNPLMDELSFKFLFS